MRIVFFIGWMILLLPSQLILAQQLQMKPNIIFIFADDLGYGDVGCYGQQKIKTPHIDQLAKDGLKFTQFYAGSTVCAPSRSSFLTGQHTGHTSIRGNKRMPQEGQIPLPDSVITFANHLQKQGYTTGAFGKWSLGFINTSGDPNKKGFDQFYGYNDQTLAHNYYPDHLWENHTRIDFPENKISNEKYSADIIHKKALDFIDEHQKPFFLYLPYTLPHADVIVPHDEVYDAYVKQFNEAPLTYKPPANDNEVHAFEPYPHAAFAAMVSRLDKYVGDIVAAVKKKGIQQNTLIIFTSDNGPHKEQGGDPEFFNSNGGLTGIKRDLYEGGIRVPFIASWKGAIKPGTTNQTAALWDMYPTFLQLAGAPVSKNIDGVSMVPTLLKKGVQTKAPYLYWEFHEQGGKQAARWQQWKGVQTNVSTATPSPIELFDLSKDAAEKNNVASKHPEMVKKMKRIFKDAHVTNNDWPFLYSELQTTQKN